MIPGITEEDEDELEMDEDMEVEEVDQFGPEIGGPSDHELVVDDAGEIYTEPVSPLSPLPNAEEDPIDATRSGSVPLTAQALAQKQEQEEAFERQADGKG